MDLKNIKVSECGTHHVLKSKPLYKRRFDTVLKFHEPGLAPVEKQGEAWHINIYGLDAYPKRFKKTFGFYEDFAAVHDNTGAYHIKSNGDSLYDKRFEWIGNFQEGLCCVRKKNGEYIHIKSDGSELTKEAWGYAGDFKDSIAVVQNQKGLSTHINNEGSIIHNNWFNDLDVFHKGYARAKDNEGWVHIDIKGKPVYHQRYAMIEPFYNGQARVETFSGALLIIDGKGQIIHKVREEKDSFHELSSDIVGFWRSHTIAAAVDLQIIEYLPSSLGELCMKLSLPENKLKRLLRGLWELGICDLDNEIWILTRKGLYLKKNSPYSLYEAATEFLWLEHKWRNLKESIKNTSCKPENNIFDEIKSIGKEKEHHKMLASYAKYDYEKIMLFLPIKNGESIVDIGGATGVLAKKISSIYNDSKITVFDILLSENFKEKNIIFKKGDFFKPWQISGDIFIMSRILHDWNDEKAIDILQNARKNISNKGKLIIIEMILKEGHPKGSLCDLHLLNVTGGRERYLNDFEILLKNADFSISEIINTPDFLSIIVAVPNE